MQQLPLEQDYKQRILWLRQLLREKAPIVYLKYRAYKERKNYIKLQKERNSTEQESKEVQILACAPKT
jgi:hypothetical protein